MKGKKLIAMVLAGGKGTRLNKLTRNLAKPALYYGGKYRIIDFALSNCSHSGIVTVGVLTQYEPFVLNNYIGSGSPWDLKRREGGVFVLPPFESVQGGNWYTATADAIYKNLKFIELYNPELVLILSGDQIYKMDYNRLIQFHQNKKAEVTIAVLQVPWSETGRFGIINIDHNLRITDFREKPEKAESNLASMGIYVFNWKFLREYLIEDAYNVESGHDFGRDLIPLMLKEKNRMYAHLFRGYWKDVGTVKSLWKANMDLLTEKSELDLFDPDWPIYFRESNNPPTYIANSAGVNRSVISEGSIIRGKLESSVISSGVKIGEDSIISNSVIMPGVRIGKKVKIGRAIIGRDTIVADGSRIGSFAENEAEDDSEIILIGSGEFVYSRKNRVKA
ncbi:MAG: glucose-1-phosphate adenylyltransferase [Bacillota bacterium]